MFGHMKAQPIIRVATTVTCDAVEALIAATENAQAVRWIEFPAALLLFVVVPGDCESGALYVFDRRTNTWLWLDFDDGQYGGYSTGDFDLLVKEYDLLTLVERPGLLRADAGWLLEPGKPAEMAGSLPPTPSVAAV
jgi:hypothetical protein